MSFTYPPVVFGSQTHIIECVDVAAANAELDSPTYVSDSNESWVWEAGATIYPTSTGGYTFIYTVSVTDIP